MSSMKSRKLVENTLQNL